MTDKHNPSHASRQIKEFALNIGFHSCGITRASAMEERRESLTIWLENGYQGEMEYMQRNINKRLDPRQLVENARSVILVLQNYYPEKSLPKESDYLISRYAYGNDYHDVIRDKLYRLFQFINETISPANGRVFTDSAPVHERALAVKAGLGWIGKNSMLITPKHGSYFFIGEIITDIELEYDNPYDGNYCGDCSRCMDACPTQAILPEGVIDARRCISYLTIEKKGKISKALKGNYRQWIFGCDICQQVCPWNRFAIPHKEPLFMINPILEKFSAKDWENLEEDEFKKYFAKSALKRAKYEGIKRNIDFLITDE